MAEYDVRQEPQPYGQGTGREPEKLVGTYDFDTTPVAGQEIELHDELWVVSEVHDGWVYVTPTPQT